MTLEIHADVEQGSEIWRDLRCGRLTASEMPYIVTPTGRAANNERSRQHLYELLAQRITRYVEPSFISDDMLRGREDEIEARALYDRHIDRVQPCGFMLRTVPERGIAIGYSPDALVGDNGQIEIKSRRQKYQIETLCGAWMPADYLVQVQTGLWVSGRAWCDFISYSGGLPMMVARVHPMPAFIDAILDAAEAFEARLTLRHTQYLATLGGEHGVRLLPTVRRIDEEIVV